MKTDDEIALDIDPDPYRLDEECVRQVKLRRVYGRMLADARRELAQAKVDRDLAEAELKLKIRSDPAAYDLDKVTEGALGDTVQAQPRYKKAVARVIECQHEVDVLDESAVRAIDHRKRSLEDLVQLHLAGYYARPSLPDGERDRVREQEQRDAWRRGKRARPASGDE